MPESNVGQPRSAVPQEETLLNAEKKPGTSRPGLPKSAEAHKCDIVELRPPRSVVADGCENRFANRFNARRSLGQGTPDPLFTESLTVPVAGIVPTVGVQEYDVAGSELRCRRLVDGIARDTQRCPGYVAIDRLDRSV
jgi:hypothetical protein